MNEIYLLIADTFTALQNDAEGKEVTLSSVIEALAEAFNDYDKEFDKVQFLNDCELVESESVL
jgi:hypothetical protein